MLQDNLSSDFPGILLAKPPKLRKHKTHKHNKFAGLSRDWVGAQNLFMCFFCSGHSLWGRKAHKQNPPKKIRGQSRDNFVYVFYSFCVFFSQNPKIREAPGTFNFLRYVMRATRSVRPKCSHRCVSLKETPLKPVQILKHTAKNSAEQAAMRTEWFKHIAI